MKVVVCDGDPVSRVAVIDLLKRFPGLEIVEASDGEEAWTLLQDSVTLLCCAAFRLPQLSGIELLRRARRTPHLHKLPFVMITSASDPEEGGKALRFGAIDSLPQPFEPAQAREHMAEVLQKVWAAVAEEPDVTLKRLGLTPDQLDRDYHAVEKQIDKVSAELAHGGATHAGTLEGRLTGLVGNCVTLGLWRGEEALQGLLSTPAEKVQVFGVLASVRSMIRHQLEQAHYA